MSNLNSKRLSAALADVRKRRYLDAYGGWIAAVVVVLINISGSFLGSSGFLPTLVSSTTILLLGVIALGTAELRRDLFATAGSSTGKLWRFFSDRSELPPLVDRFQNHRTVHVFGLQLGEIIHSALPDLQEKARRGTEVRLALFSPVDEYGHKSTWVDAVAYVHRFPNLEEILRTNLRTLRLWHSELPKSIAKNVDIRAYSEVPTASVILLDEGLRSCELHIEPMLHRLEPSNRPAFWIRSGDDPSLTSAVSERYIELWEKSTSIYDLKI